MSFDEAQKCGAKTKRTGKHCKGLAMANGKCRMHGGNSKVGLASSTFKTGKYSKYLPANLSDKYNDAINDPELTSAREGIALIDAFTKDRLEKLYKGESIDYIARLKATFADYLSELDNIQCFCNTTAVLRGAEFPEYLSEKTYEDLGDDENKTERIERANRYLTEMKELLERGLETANVFERVQDMLEIKRKHQETENKRLKDLNQTITAEAAMQIVLMIAGIIQRNVTDRDQRTKINSELNDIVVKQIG
jgi:hypothetical protein